MYVADRKPPGSPALPSWPARSRTLSDPRFYARVGGINWDTVPSPCPSCCSPPRWPFQAADGSFDSSHRARLCVCRERAVGRRRARVVGRRKNATREAKTTLVVRNRLRVNNFSSGIKKESLTLRQLFSWPPYFGAHFAPDIGSGPRVHQLNTATLLTR